jgi:hypothetical protein
VLSFFDRERFFPHRDQFLPFGDTMPAQKAMVQTARDVLHDAIILNRLEV